MAPSRKSTPKIRVGSSTNSSHSSGVKKQRSRKPRTPSLLVQHMQPIEASRPDPGPIAKPPKKKQSKENPSAKAFQEQQASIEQDATAWLESRRKYAQKEEQDEWLGRILGMLKPNSNQLSIVAKRRVAEEARRAFRVRMGVAFSAAMLLNWPEYMTMSLQAMPALEVLRR